MRRRVMLIGFSAAVVAAAGGALTATLRPEPLTATSIGVTQKGVGIVVHVGPGGGGTSSGEERTASSLAEAQKIVKREGASKATVLVRGGTYRDESLVWDYSPMGGTITIRPEPGTGRVVYDGGGRPGYWVTVRPGPAKIHFSGMTVQNYTGGGIWFRDDPSGRTRSAGGSVKHMVFQRMGTRYGSGTPPSSEGHSAVRLSDSRHMTIRNNAFRNLENDTGHGPVHGIHFDGSADNSASGNVFVEVGGDPIRAGDGASGNRVIGNRFQTSGRNGVFSYAASSRRTVCGKNNYFAGNTYGKAYPHPRSKSFEDRPVDQGGRDACTPDPIKVGPGNRYAPDLHLSMPG